VRSKRGKLVFELAYRQLVDTVVLYFDNRHVGKVANAPDDRRPVARLARGVARARIL
jgi:hypothetical protein